MEKYLLNFYKIFTTCSLNEKRILLVIFFELSNVFPSYSRRKLVQIEKTPKKQSWGTF